MVNVLSSLGLYRTVSVDQAHELLTAPIFETCGENPCIKVRAAESGACIPKGLKGVRSWFLKELKRNPKAKLFQSYATFNWASWGGKTSIKEWNMDRRFWSVLDLDMPEVDGKKGVISDEQIAAIQEFFPNSLILVGNGIQIFFLAGGSWTIDAYLLREMGKFVAAKVGLFYDNLHVRFDGHPARRQTQAFRSPFSYADRANRPTICMIPALYEKFDTVEGAFKRFGLPTPAIPTAKELLEAPRRQGVGQKQPRKGNGSSLEKYGELSAICSARAKLMLKGMTLEDAVIQVAGQNWSYWGSREIQTILLKPEFAPFVRAGVGSSGDWENREYDNDADGKFYYGGYKKSHLCLKMQRSRTLYACRAWALQFLYHTGDSAAEIIEHFHNWPILAEIRHHSIAAIKLSKQAVADLEEEHDGDEAAVKAAIRERQIEILNADLMRVISKFYDEGTGTTKNVARLVHPETRQRVWEAAQRLGTFTTTQISRELPRWESKQIRRALTQLMKAGKLNRTGSTKATTWELPQTPTSPNTPINLLCMSELPLPTTTTMKTTTNQTDELSKDDIKLLKSALKFPALCEKYRDLLEKAGLIPPLPAEIEDDMPPDVDDEPEPPADLPPDVEEEPVPAPILRAITLKQIQKLIRDRESSAKTREATIQKLTRTAKISDQKEANLAMREFLETQSNTAYKKSGLVNCETEFREVYSRLLIGLGYELNYDLEDRIYKPVWHGCNLSNLLRYIGTLHYPSPAMIAVFRGLHRGVAMDEAEVWAGDIKGWGQEGIAEYEAGLSAHFEEVDRYKKFLMRLEKRADNNARVDKKIAILKNYLAAEPDRLKNLKLKLRTASEVKTVDLSNNCVFQNAVELAGIFTEADLPHILNGARTSVLPAEWGNNPKGFGYIWKRLISLIEEQFKNLLTAELINTYGELFIGQSMAAIFADFTIDKLHLPPKPKTWKGRLSTTAQVGAKRARVLLPTPLLAEVERKLAGKA